jgi:hypothetical protein
MVVDFTEYRLTRQLRSASTPSRCTPPESATGRGAVLVLLWRKVGPSAYLMVDPRNGARAVIRDTRSDAGPISVERLAVGGYMRPVSEGRTDDLAQAQSIAAAALGAYAANRITEPGCRPLEGNAPPGCRSLVGSFRSL